MQRLKTQVPRTEYVSLVANKTDIIITVQDYSKHMSLA